MVTKQIPAYHPVARIERDNGRALVWLTCGHSVAFNASHAVTLGEHRACYGCDVPEAGAAHDVIPVYPFVDFAAR